MDRRSQLNVMTTGTVNAAGNLTITFGPADVPGNAYWNVTRIVVENQNAARRGKPPIPTCAVYVDSSTNGAQDITYDGSYDATDVDIDLARGQSIVAQWAGGQSGDVMILSLNGWKT